jgi:hypothetical protein
MSVSFVLGIRKRSSQAIANVGSALTQKRDGALHQTARQDLLYKKIFRDSRCQPSQCWYLPFTHNLKHVKIGTVLAKKPDQIAIQLSIETMNSITGWLLKILDCPPAE